ncbi:Pex12 amino terminal region-domain-containing protein [Pavlovales sp. CCMP2436]|nr:Pex12 amino terminal region-domain-containing protein [Pavlovales sp. CCMP2436]
MEDPLPCATHQLDAQQLDADLMRALGAQWKRVFTHMSRTVADAIEPEREALLRLLIWCLTFRGRNVRTPGQALQNLRLVSARDEVAQPRRAARQQLLSRAAVLELLLAVLAPWVIDRLRAHASARRWAEAEPGSARHILWRALNASEGAAKVLQLLSTLSLLAARRPFALRHVLTGTRVSYTAVGAPSFALAFEFVGQQLLWQALTEHAAFFSELAPSRAFLRALGRRGMRAASTLLGAAGALRVGAGCAGAADAPTAELQCVECRALPASIPCRAVAEPPAATEPPARSAESGRKGACGHVHCYACLSSALAADSHHACRVCARRVRAIARVEWTLSETAQRGAAG